MNYINMEDAKKINNWKVNHYFADTDSFFVVVGAEKDEKYFEVMIDTYNDPYRLYYLDGNTPENKKEMEKEIFEYLSKELPDYFG